MQIQLMNHHPTQIDLKTMEMLAQKLLLAEGCSNMLEVSVLFTDDSRIARLNKNFRGIKGPTDVLSFSLSEGEELIDPSSVTALGDVVISVDTAQKQAHEHGHSLQEEIATLLVHGLLHLLGYDHTDDADAKIMFERQDAILRDFK